MSYNLWKCFFDDDVDSFRLYLARATFDRNASRGTGGGNFVSSFKTGSPGALGTSPKSTLKSRKSGGNVTLSEARGNAIVLTRSDVNVRDAHGRTLLHHAVSSHGENALDFVKLLLQIPLLDLYVQDTESGWTALHRALYSGNIAAAQALMLKDIQNATDYTTNVSHVNAGGLVKIKDHEGNSPFELFGLTTAPRDLQEMFSTATLDTIDAKSQQSVDMDVETGAAERLAQNTQPVTNLFGDEIFAFGSNKNITLGLGDGDDRTFPERIQLTRPDLLLRRLHDDFLATRKNSNTHDSSADLSEVSELPSVVRHTPVLIQNVVMSKLHTAVLTNDPISNLHVCGFGPGGRLGTGDEATRFSFTCIQGGGLAKRKVSSIALGQDHTVAVCTSGEVFTWGNNKYGQLGYELPDIPAQEAPLQLTPRQIYGLIKKEQIIGAAASSLHSAVYTSVGLYTFGKNDGQLGLMDADARSLEIQVIPRRVGVSIIQHPIQSVAAIDRATTILLENHDVIVFTHYGWTRVVFPLDSFGSSIASDAFFIRHKRQTKHISQISSGGNTICALTSYGEVFTIDVPRHADSVPSSKSTTNPSKARNALPTPSKVWSIRKSHMAATDAAVGQDGSVILCTSAGTVWKKEKRANIKSVHLGNARTRPKDYKFVRVPNVFGATAVRSNSFGAFIAVRKDCEVMKEQIIVEPATIHDKIFDLLAFKDYGSLSDDENAEEPQPRFWSPTQRNPCPALIKRALLLRTNAHDDFAHITKRHEPLSNSDYDVWVTSDIADVRLPVHSFVLKARSKMLRAALATFHESYYFAIPDVLSLEYGPDGHIRLQLTGADFFTVVNLVLYFYTDTVVNVWQHTSKALEHASRYRAVRVELMKIATALDLKQLERAVRIMDEPFKSLREDFEVAFNDSDLFSDADVVIDLADGEERYAHSVILQARCPFFEGLFHGHTGGMWLADRRNTGEDGPDAIRVDLKHINSETFEIVLQHIYADTDEELFDSIAVPDLDGFIDIVIEVMSVANELMLERLARVCQKVVGRYVTPWNICGLLNAVAESSEIEFKHAGLEYVGLNLENMLEQRLLEELDAYLMEELDEMVQSNQLAFMPIARSGRALEVMIDHDPALSERIEASRLRRLDSMQLPSRYVMEPYRPTAGQRTRSDQTDAQEIDLSDPSSGRRLSSLQVKPTAKSDVTAEDLQFDMDEEHLGRSVSSSTAIASPELEPLETTTLRPSLSRLSSSQQIMQDLELDSNSSSLATTPRVGDRSNSNSAQRAAWTTANVNSPRLDLKDIMSQDASTKVSNLTQSLKQAALASKQPATKLSQKDRKRQQHEMKLQYQAQTAVEVDNGVKQADKSSSGSGAPESPWQKVAPKPITPSQKPDTPIVSSPSMSRTQSAATQPSQTGPAKSAKQKNDKPSQPNRSVSSPGMTGVSKAPPPQIQSIRHNPTPTRSASWIDARTSMADILAQQQYEKKVIKETAAARSLQEIQQEQEFQAWWDSETRRIQEEEAATMAAIRRASGRGGGGGGGGGGGRGKNSSKRRASDRGPPAKTGQESASKPTVPVSDTQAAEAPAENSSAGGGRGGRNRSRGGRGGAARGRGRGSIAS